MLDLALSLAFSAALVTVVRYFMSFLRAVRDGRKGAQFLITAFFTVALMVLLQRGWVIVLRYYDRPDWLVDSAMTIFIPWMLAWAITLAFIAPDVDDYNTGDKSGVLRSIALFIGGALAGFIIASSFQGKIQISAAHQVWPHLAHRAQCPSEKEVWVSSNGIYHNVDSPYRGMVTPDWCFSSESEAEAKGFRKAKGIGADAQ